jgi:hypothetical protein
MKNEFEKLDTFMRQNRPDIIQIPQRRSPGSNDHPWLRYVLACGIAVIISIGVIKHHHDEAQSALLLAEVLSWDVTSDEFPSEVETELAMSDF